MSFFAPFVKVFSLKINPPSPSTFNKMSEVDIRRVCLPTEKNNAMFIPEFPMKKYPLESSKSLKNESYVKRYCDENEFPVIEYQRKTDLPVCGGSDCAISSHPRIEADERRNVIGTGLPNRNSSEIATHLHLKNPLHTYFYDLKPKYRQSKYIGSDVQPMEILTDQTNCEGSGGNEPEFHSSLSQLFFTQDQYEESEEVVSESNQFVRSTTNIEKEQDSENVVENLKPDFGENSRTTNHIEDDSQLSVSLLFQSEEFNLSDYQYIMGCDVDTSLSEKCDDYAAVEESDNSREDIIQEPNVTIKCPQINKQPFVIKGCEPKIFDTTVKLAIDNSWKVQIRQNVIEPSVEVLKRDEVVFEELPIVVSPYFPNEGNHPVQNDRRTTINNDSMDTINSQSVELSFKKINSDLKTIEDQEENDEHEMIKTFYTPCLHELKRRRQVSNKKESSSKKLRLSIKDKINSPKITNYFPIIKNPSINRPHKISDGFQNDVHRENVDVERSMCKFRFDDLPLEITKKMSSFFNPTLTGEIAKN